MAKDTKVVNIHGGTARALERVKDIREAPDVSGTVRGQDRARDGLTAKQEAFAQAVSEGMTLSDAYRHAYDASNMKPATIHSQASKLLGNPEVAARVNGLLGEREAGQLHERTRLRRIVVAGLEREATDMNTSAQARIAALKALGMLDIVQAFRPDAEASKDDRTPEEIRRELMQRMVRMQASDKPDEG